MGMDAGALLGLCFLSGCELWKSSGSLDCLLRGSLSCPPARLLSFVLPLGTLLAKSFPSFQESLFPLCAYSQCLEHAWASAGSFSIWMNGLTSQVAHISLRALFACYLAMHGHTHSVSSLHSVWCVFSNTLRALEASSPVFHVRRSFDPSVLVALTFVPSSALDYQKQFGWPKQDFCGSPGDWWR